MAKGSGCDNCDGELFIDLSTGGVRCMACEIRFRRDGVVKSKECTLCLDRFVDAAGGNAICKSCARDIADKAQPKTATQVMQEEQAKGIAGATRRLEEEKAILIDRHSARHSNVTEMGPHCYMSVDEMLTYAVRDHGMADAILMGYDKRNGRLIILSSNLTRAQANFMIDKAKLWTLEELKHEE